MNKEAVNYNIDALAVAKMKFADFKEVALLIGHMKWSFVKRIEEDILNEYNLCCKMFHGGEEYARFNEKTEADQWLRNIAERHYTTYCGVE